MVAFGSVKVAAEVPENTSVLSEAPAVTELVNVLVPVEMDPRTSRVEFGVVVPTPTCA